ncbi:MAG TPA: regulatory iron-sulfur-containing complex subunit RicT, partial [Chlamydiales bacterium]|nr:regulatory iron-sulfur-containing complex subunit RicT [Chlamydiales bacterium]
LGGIGVCGRELCCSTWLTDFKTVSTSAARYQNLALNPAKLAGQCTKLKCCLNYELDSYLDALRDLPSTSIVLETEKGRAFHRKTDIFKRLLWYAFSVDEKREQSELVEGGVGGNWVVLSVDRVKEIVELNRKNIKPVDLKLPEDDVIIAEPDYENVVGQDRIDRMDKLKKKKKKKKKKSGGEDRPVVAAQTASDQPRPIQPHEPRQNQPRRQQQPRTDQPKQNQPKQNQPNQNKQRQQNQPRKEQPDQAAPPQPNPRQQPRTNPPRQHPNRQQPGGTAEPQKPAQPSGPEKDNP